MKTRVFGVIGDRMEKRNTPIGEPGEVEGNRYRTNI